MGAFLFLDTWIFVKFKLVGATRSLWCSGNFVENQRYESTKNYFELFYLDTALGVAACFWAANPHQLDLCQWRLTPRYRYWFSKYCWESESIFSEFNLWQMPTANQFCNAIHPKWANGSCFSSEHGW